MMAPNGPQSFADSLRKVLNSKGYGFQYAALQKCIEAQIHPPWQFAVAEFPVILHGQEIHIDFVLGSRTHLIVAECKRITRRMWGFARSHKSQSGSAPRPRADFLTFSSDRRLVRYPMWFGPAHRPYDVAVELKEQGQHHSESGAINDAVSQVMRARGGLIDELLLAGPGLRYGGGAIVPVVFTNAPLVTTQTELATAHIETGDLPTIAADQADWLWFDYNLSRSLRPMLVQPKPDDLQAPTKTQWLRSVLFKEAMRSVAIVNFAGIEPFLQSLASIDVQTEPIEF